MRSPKQIAASRANGARSKGPVTAQGKRNSSRNAIRHGLLAQTPALQAEYMVRFLSFREALHREYCPSTPAETTLLDTFAYARARQQRIWEMQRDALNRAAASGPLCAQNFPKEFEALAKYEVTLDRQMATIYRSLAQLKSKSQRPENLTRNDCIPKGTQQPIENTVSGAGAS